MACYMGLVNDCMGLVDVLLFCSRYLEGLLMFVIIAVEDSVEA